MHFIKAYIYAVSDDDIGGDCTLVVTTSSQEEICGTSADKLGDFLKRIGASSSEWAYPIAVKSNGYASIAWTGIYCDPSFGELQVISSTSSIGGTTKAVKLNLIKEAVIEM